MTTSNEAINKQKLEALLLLLGAEELGYVKSSGMTYKGYDWGSKLYYLPKYESHEVVIFSSHLTSPLQFFTIEDAYDYIKATAKKTTKDKPTRRANSTTPTPEI
jgi:hypothetical protein